MKIFIKNLNHLGIKTKASCCGHHQYPISIIVGTGIGNLEIVSGLYINRKSRFYKKDEDGYYYIPEVVKAKI